MTRPSITILSVGLSAVRFKRASMRLTSTVGLNGFVIKSSAPHSKHSSSSNSSPRAVRKMTGTSEVSRILRQTSQPFISGIIISSTARAISLFSAKTCRACAPSSASTVSKPLAVRKSLIMRRIFASSSAISIFCKSYPPSGSCISARPGQKINYY